MIHTNHGELLRIFDTYCHCVWKAGGQATLTTSTEGGLLKANLDIQLGRPSAACPGAPPPHLVRTTVWSSSPSSTSAPCLSSICECGMCFEMPNVDRRNVILKGYFVLGAGQPFSNAQCMSL